MEGNPIADQLDTKESKKVSSGERIDSDWGKEWEW